MNDGEAERGANHREDSAAGVLQNLSRGLDS